LRRWKHVTDDAILDNAESMHLSVIAQVCRESKSLVPLHQVSPPLH
jgi:hypothetical protein